MDSYYSYFESDEIRQFCRFCYKWCYSNELTNCPETQEPFCNECYGAFMGKCSNNKNNKDRNSNK